MNVCRKNKQTNKQKEKSVERWMSVETSNKQTNKQREKSIEKLMSVEMTNKQTKIYKSGYLSNIGRFFVAQL